MDRMNLNPTARDPQAPKAAVSAGSAPRLGPPPHLVSDSFWTNLKDFLTERAIKIPRNAPQNVFRADGLDDSFSESVKAFFRPGPHIKNGASSAMAVEWQPEYRVFWHNLRDLIAPPKLPPLKLTSKPVAVRSLWAKREEFGRAQGISLAMHILLAILLIVPLARKIVQTKQTISANVTPIEISPYATKLPAGKDKAGGGGGGGERMPTPPTRGKLPRWSMTQLTPPMAVPRNPNPILPAEPTLLGPPDLKVPSTNDPNFGDPLAKFLTGSGGPGGGGGIGTGEGGGIGSGPGGTYVGRSASSSSSGRVGRCTSTSTKVSTS